MKQTLKDYNICLLKCVILYLIGFGLLISLNYPLQNLEHNIILMSTAWNRDIDLQNRLLHFKNKLQTITIAAANLLKKVL